MKQCCFFTPAALLCLTLFLNGCSSSPQATDTCQSCHSQLEPVSSVSSSHDSCISCHGGDNQDPDEKRSHATLFGPGNPSSPEHWEQTCGNCHPYQLERLKNNIMFTATGMIRNTQKTWEGETEARYASQAAETFDASGKPLELKGVAELDNLSGELFRKFCAPCHVAIPVKTAWSANHASGCAACHFPYNDAATYTGNDSTMQGKRPHSASHTMASLPGNDVCFRCHNRSGRIALSYQGLLDGNNALVPTDNGRPGPRLASGIRSMTSITPDIHFTRGMECIDCHTSRDIMGDGYSYQNMYQQTEIRCEDCHGSPTSRPQTEEIARENDEAVRESGHYPRQMGPGDQMVLTTKGRKYANVFLEQDTIQVQGKRNGKLHLSKVITNSPEHTIAGHQRLECAGCHSRTVIQCYGCHTLYDQTKPSLDFIKNQMTPGKFSETEDYRTLYPFPLGINERGQITPVTPGCQTFVSEIDSAGRTIRQEEVSLYQGRKQLRFAPISSHNTGERAISCRECHSNPIFYGFGQNIIEQGDIKGTLLCEINPNRALDSLLTMEQGRITPHSAVVREGARPLNQEEITRTMRVNLCLACHDQGTDPIYQQPLDYAKLDDCLNRPLPPARSGDRDDRGQ